MSEVIIIQLTKDELKDLIKESVKAILKQQTTQEPSAYDRLLKIDEVCALLKVSRVTIHKWKKAGVIPFHRISNRIFFKGAEVMEALRKIDTSVSRQFKR
jgi:excisionase family DNA binding protein